jgi:hypothetical protein
MSGTEPMVTFGFVDTVPSDDSFRIDTSPVDEDDLRDEAHLLIQRARAIGLVITIECRSLQPLAMGNIEQVVEFRPVRG